MYLCERLDPEESGHVSDPRALEDIQAVSSIFDICHVLNVLAVS